MAFATGERSASARRRELDAAWTTWPRGDRPAALREAGAAFRRRFAERGQVHADPDRRPGLRRAIPATFAFHGAARVLNPYVNILNRLVVVQFDDFEGARRTLVWEPTDPRGLGPGARSTPSWIDRFGE